MAAAFPVVEGVYAQDRDAGVVHIFDDQDWYRASPEPERTWRGRLAERSVEGGPGGRPSLKFELNTSNGAIPVYANGANAHIAKLLGGPIEVRGKLINLGREGFGSELWIGSARKLPAR